MNFERFLEGLVAGETIEFTRHERLSYVFRRNDREWPIAIAQRGADSYKSLGIPLRHIIYSWNMGLRAIGLRVMALTASRENGEAIENLQEEWFNKDDLDPSLPWWGQYGGGWPRGVARITFTVVSIIP
jgi:hypothetical protein